MTHDCMRVLFVNFFGGVHEMQQSSSPNSAALGSKLYSELNQMLISSVPIIDLGQRW